MPELHQYRLFISHAWAYNDEYNRIIQFLNQTSNFSYSNYSVPKHDPVDANNPTKLKEELRQQIRPVEVVIVLSGMYVAYSDWIKFEIDFASLQLKPILGVKPWGSEVIPTAVSAAAVEMVGWNTDSIVNAIRRLAK